jgi:hypothetical protein
MLTTMTRTHGSLKELSWLKEQARKSGNKGEILENIPSYYGYGQYAEIAVMGLLGYTQKYLSTKQIWFRLEQNAELDRCGVDVKINNETIQLKSKYTYQYMYTVNADLCYVEYDAVGMQNLYEILDHIGFPPFFMDEEFKARINKMWSSYMKYFQII